MILPRSGHRRCPLSPRGVLPECLEARRGPPRKEGRDAEIQGVEERETPRVPSAGSPPTPAQNPNTPLQEQSRGPKPPARAGRALWGPHPQVVRDSASLVTAALCIQCPPQGARLYPRALVLPHPGPPQSPAPASPQRQSPGPRVQLGRTRGLQGAWATTRDSSLTNGCKFSKALV